VSTHSDLCAYLVAKAPPGVCRVATLPFEGKNVVIYSLGEDDPDAGLCRAVSGAAV